MPKKSRIDTSAAESDFGQNPFGGLAVPGEGKPVTPPSGSAKATVSAAATKAAGPTLNGRVELRREKAGRGGKTATTARGPIFQQIGAAARAGILKELKAQLGTGGSELPDGIEVRGDVRDAVEAYLRERGAKVVRAGG